MGNIDSVLQIRYRLMMILKERKLYLPTEIWQLLESAFDLENTIRQSREFINNRSLNYIWNYYLRQLKQPSLRYEFLLQAEGLDYEQFLQLRDQGYTALCQNNLRRAEFDLKQAYALFADDPELLRLLGECCMRAGQYEMALAYFDQLIRVLPEEIDGHLYKARIWYGMGQFIQAAEQCLSILSQWPGNYDAVILLSHCRKNLGEHKETEDLLNKAVMLSCQNPDILVEQPYYMEVNQTHRRNWKRLLSKKILIHMITLLATSALIVSCISYFMYMNSQNTTFTVTNLKDLELISEQEYAELTISNLKDTKVNQYPDEHGSTDSIIYENSAYAFLNYNQYGDPTYRIYLGELEFDGQHIIVAADPTVDMLNIPNGTSIKGYVHTVNSRLESVVTHMLKWKPSNPEGTPEAKLELYNKSIAIGYSPDSESKSIPVPDIYQKYIEVTAPRWNSPVNTQNIALLVLILAIWTHSLYHLIFEYRKKRGLL
ncbi:Tetratricopeptide repeat protein [compost metagenome]